MVESWGDRFNRLSADGQVKQANWDRRVKAVNAFLNGQPFHAIRELQAAQKSDSMMKRIGFDEAGKPLWVNHIGGQEDLRASQRFWGGLQFGVDMAVYVARSKERGKARKIAREVWRRRQAKRQEEPGRKPLGLDRRVGMFNLFDRGFEDYMHADRMERLFGKPPKPEPPKPEQSKTQKSQEKPEPQEPQEPKQSEPSEPSKGWDFPGSGDQPPPRSSYPQPPRQRWTMENMKGKQERVDLTKRLPGNEPLAIGQKPVEQPRAASNGNGPKPHGGDTFIAFGAGATDKSDNQPSQPRTSSIKVAEYDANENVYVVTSIPGAGPKGADLGHDDHEVIDMDMSDGLER